MPVYLNYKYFTLLFRLTKILNVGVINDFDSPSSVRLYATWIAIVSAANISLFIIVIKYLFTHRRFQYSDAAYYLELLTVVLFSCMYIFSVLENLSMHFNTKILAVLHKVDDFLQLISYTKERSVFLFAVFVVIFLSKFVLMAFKVFINFYFFGWLEYWFFLPFHVYEICITVLTFQIYSLIMYTYYLYKDWNVEFQRYVRKCINLGSGTNNIILNMSCGLSQFNRNHTYLSNVVDLIDGRYSSHFLGLLFCIVVLATKTIYNIICAFEDDYDITNFNIQFICANILECIYYMVRDSNLCNM